jgi:hypothetical protein
MSLVNNKHDLQKVRSSLTLEVTSSNRYLSLVQLFRTSIAYASTAGPVKKSQRDVDPVLTQTGVFDRETLPLQPKPMSRAPQPHILQPRDLSRRTSGISTRFSDTQPTPAKTI